MKWLKNYSLFREGVDIDDGDNIDVKAAKTSFNDVKSHIDEFKNKKSKIDNIFQKKGIDKKQLDREIESILGSSYSEDGSSERNPFLSNYIRVASDQRRLDNLLNDVVTDRESLQSNKSLLANVDDEEQKASLQNTVDIISKRIQDSQTSIEILKKDINNNKQKIENNMKEAEKEILGSITDMENTRK